MYEQLTKHLRLRCLKTSTDKGDIDEEVDVRQTARVLHVRMMNMFRASHMSRGSGVPSDVEPPKLPFLALLRTLYSNEAAAWQQVQIPDDRQCYVLFV